MPNVHGTEGKEILLVKSSIHVTNKGTIPLNIYSQKIHEEKKNLELWNRIRIQIKNQLGKCMYTIVVALSIE